MAKPLVGVVLAAGQGTRMKSSLPKVLHEICGRPMLGWILHSLAEIKPEEIVVVIGHGAGEVGAYLETLDLGVPIRSVVQAQQNGTGDAARVALESIDPGDRDVLVLPGDSPLITPATLSHMVDVDDSEKAAATLLTVQADDPAGYGRVVRTDDGSVSKIVEEADCSDAQRLITEVAMSMYVFDEMVLRRVLGDLRPDNAQGELYLPDVIERLTPDVSNVAGDADETRGINDRAQLASVERLARARLLDDAMRAGVTVQDPTTTYVSADADLVADVTLLAGTHLEGKTRIGAGSVVGPGAQLIDTTVGEGCTLSYCVVRDSIVGDGAEVGPYASLRAGTVMHADSKVGTFVETKKTTIGAGSKVPHLSYVGDCTIGEAANLGANTITCNYDGVDKHETTIGDGVKTGSGTLLVAPVELGHDAYTGAGAVVTQDVPAESLAKGLPAEIDNGWTTRNRAPRADES